MRVAIYLVAMISWVFCKECEKGEVLKLSNQVKMKCKNGVWVPKENKAGPGAPPCVDNPALVANGSCLANAQEGHCSQFTVKGQEMDRDCPGTCDSCDACRCKDASKWHPYCGYWSQYCNNPGVLGTWMTTNCRKTCNKCRCKCCSYKGKQHKLGARILLPDVCGALICEEFLRTKPSPLLSGAVQHAVTHPEELTLTFESMFPGRECCLLPGTGRSENSSILPSGSMVQEGWIGSLTKIGGQSNITCSHGSLYKSLEDISCNPRNTSSPTSKTTTTTTSTTTTTTTPKTTTTITTITTITTTTTTNTANHDQCSQAYTTVSDSWRKVKYTQGGASSCKHHCDNRYKWTEKWYRFKEPAGTKLPLKEPPLSSIYGKHCEVCQTTVSAWIKEGRDPVFGEGIMDITLCDAYATKPCFWGERAGKAVACKEGGSIFYLYYLKPHDGCSSAYCTLSG